VIGLLERIAAEKGPPGPDRPGLAAGAKTLDCAIPGSRKLERLDENLGAAKIELTATDLSEIAKAMSQIKVVGDRY